MPNDSLNATNEATTSESGTHRGESLGGALRRNAAWLALARGLVASGGDVEQVLRDLDHVALEIAKLSLEVDELTEAAYPRH